MNPSWETIVVLVGLLASMAAYALFAGADFGGGIWDLLAGSTKKGAEPRAEIDASVTPVWEGNQTWIVLGLVLFWTSFPSAFAAVMTGLFVPLSLSLLGIVLRGVGFAFRHESERLATQQLNGVLFGASSILAPFFLGTAVGALATGKITPATHGNQPSAWLATTPLLTGGLFVACCAYIGAVYLVGDAHQRGRQDMVRYFSHRALASGAVTGLLALANLVLMRDSASYVLNRLLGPALPLVAVSVAGGLAAFGLVLAHRVFLLRAAAGLAVCGVIAAWGVAQYPWLFPRTLSLGAASAPRAALVSEIAVLGMAAVLVAPAFAYLYWLQQHGRLGVTEPSQQLRLAVRAENPPPSQDEASPGPVRAAGAAVTLLAAVALVRRLLRRPGGP